MKRLLDCRASDFAQKPSPEGFKSSIVAAEGRVIMAEFDANTSPYYPGVSNAEILCAFGADLILIKSMDLQALTMTGADKSFGADAIAQTKKLTGRLVGVSLQVLPKDQLDAPNAFTAENLKNIRHADFICLTAYDKPGITSDLLLEAIEVAKQHFDGLIMAVKYLSSGVAEGHLYASFANAGADVVIIPAPGSVRLSSEARVEAAIEAVHQAGAVAATTISSSQEGSDCDTIREIGLASKRCGTDMINFGDAGISGIPAPEAVQSISVAIRGKRHTYVRMAASLAR